MPNEIYHRSNWGESKAEDFGDVYYDHAATNKLYNHSDYYENSDGTDATLKDLNNKASIVLTPTAYSDGSLNTVIPPYQVLPTELVTNGDFSNGTTDWTIDDASNGDISVVDGKLQITSNGGTGYPVVKQEVTTSIGKKYSVSFSVTSNTTGFWFRVNDSQSGLGGFKTFYSNDKTSSIIFKGEFTAISTNSWLKIFAEQNDSGSFKIDNVSVKEVQEADFDFSRGSSATRVNEQGLVEDVQILSGELVQNGNFEQIGSEFITNGYFSDGTTGWVKGTAPSATQEVVNGALVMYAGSNADANNALSRTDTPQGYNGKIYKLELNRSDFVNGTLGYLRLDGVYDPSNIISFGAGTSDIYFTAYRDFTHVRFFAGSAEAGYTIDNVSLKEVGQNWTFGTGWSIEDGVVSANAPSGNLDQSLSATSGSKYRVTFTILNYVSGDIRWRFTGTSNENGTLRSANGTYTEEITLTNNQSIFRFPATSGVMDIDNVSIVEVTDDTDLPRIDFTDGTGSLLLEPQRTNSLPYSEDFTTYNNNHLSIESNTQETLSPQGIYNATKFTATGTDPYVFKSGINVTANTQTASIYVKGVGDSIGKEGRILFWYIGTAGGSSTSITFTLTSDWQRVEGSSTPTSSGTLAIRVDLPNTAEVGDESYVYGFQMEEGSYATSYIPTSGSTVTRSADVANNSGNTDLFNDSEGVLYAEIAALADDGTSRTISINNTSSNRVFLQLRATTGQVNSGVVVGGVLQGSAMSYAVLQTSNIKLAIKYKQNDFSLFVNGLEVGTSSGNVFTSGTLNDLTFDSGSGAEDFYGKVKCIAVFKEALSNDLLERLTGEGYESFRLLAEANNYTII